MRVIATATGFDGLAVREEGDTFDMPETTKVNGEDVPVKSSWYKPLDKAAKSDKVVKKDETKKDADLT